MWRSKQHSLLLIAWGLHSYGLNSTQLPQCCSTGRVAAIGGEPGAGSRWENVHGGSAGACEHPLDRNGGQLLLCGSAWVWFSWTSKGGFFFPPASDIYKIYYFNIFFRNVLLFPYVCEAGSSRSPERSASAIVFL